MRNQPKTDGRKRRTEYTVTHKNIDIDGAIENFFWRFSKPETNKMIFWGGGSLKIPSECRKLIFLDCKPDNRLSRELKKKKIETVVVDHHPHAEYPDPNDEEHPKTATSMLAERLLWKLREMPLADKNISRWEVFLH